MLIGNINCAALDNSPMVFRPDAPPAMPNLPGLPPQAQQVVPYLAATVANNINNMVSGQSGPPSPARIFVYNACIRDQYNNQVFLGMVALAADLVFFRYGSTNQDVLARAANEVCQIEIAKTIMQYPQLQQLMDRRMTEEASQLIGQFGQIYNDIQNVKNQRMNQQQQPTGYYPNAPQPQQFYGAPQAPMGGGYNPNFQTPGIGNRPPIVGNNPLFGAPVQTQGQLLQTAFSSTPAAKNDKYAYLQPTTPALDLQVGQPIQAMPVAVQVPQKWANSNMQAYPPAFLADRETAVLVSRIDPITTLPCAIIQIVNKEDKEMDRNRHKTTADPKQSTSGQTVNENKLNDTLAAASENLALPKHKGVVGAIEGSSDEDDSLGLCSTLDDALFAARCKLQLNNRGNTAFKAHTTYSINVKSIIGDTNHRDLIMGLSKCKTFVSVAQTISEYVFSTRNTPSGVAVKEFAGDLDKYLTTELNNLMRTRLAIQTTIDGFCSDTTDLLNYIAGNSGDAFSNALRSYQEQFIKSVINAEYLDDASHEQFSNYIESEIGDGAIGVDFVTVIPQVISVTSLGAKAADLNLGMYIADGNILTSERFPALVNFANSLFRVVRKSDEFIAHHYIETSDHQVYELNEGIVGNGVILISKVA